MMSTKIFRYPLNSLVFKRLMSGQTAAKHSESESLKSQQLQTTTLPNGLIVSSLENYSPITRIGVIVRAGARYEPTDQLGLTHTLRSMAGFSTKNSTVFGITRNVEYTGGSLTALTTRDDIIYILENNRGVTDTNIRYLSDTVLNPAFKHWEIKDNLNRQRFDLSVLNNSQQLVLLDALHSVAFRGGLRNSIYSPEFMIGKHSSDSLSTYVEHHFVSNRSAIVGVGIEHNHLLELVNQWFSMARGDRGFSGVSKFIGGETRIITDSDITNVAIACEGVGAKNSKDALALSLFQSILGTGPRVKYSSGQTKLSQTVAKSTAEPFAVSSFNINYSDTGLFGVTIAASYRDIDSVVKSVVKQLRDSAKNISEEDLKNAKNQLKASTLLATEEPSILVEEIGTQCLTSGQVLTLSDFQKTVDSITVEDVSSLALKTIKGKGALAAVGRLQNTPYLEDLV